jgi:hypothetical protein
LLTRVFNDFSLPTARSRTPLQFEAGFQTEARRLQIVNTLIQDLRLLRQVRSSEDCEIRSTFSNVFGFSDSDHFSLAKALPGDQSSRFSTAP